MLITWCWWWWCSVEVCVCVCVDSFEWSHPVEGIQFPARHSHTHLTTQWHPFLSPLLSPLSQFSLSHTPVTLSPHPNPIPCRPASRHTHTHIHLQYLSHDLPTYLPFAPFDICLEKCILCVINFTISIEINLFWEKRTSTKDKGNTVCC